MSRLAAEAGENAPPVDLSLERRLEAVTALALLVPDVTHREVVAGAMKEELSASQDDALSPRN